MNKLINSNKICLRQFKEIDKIQFYKYSQYHYWGRMAWDQNISLITFMKKDPVKNSPT